MAISVSSRPSAWSAVKNPIVYKLLHYDSGFEQVNDNGGFAQLQLNGVDFTALFPVGDTVYINGAVYSGLAEITASAFSGGNTLITVDLAYSATDTGTFLNTDIRTDYHIEVEVFKSSDDTSLTGGVRFSFTHGVNGIVYADIAEVLKAYVGPDWIEPSVLNEAEENSSLGYYIKYQEYYDGALVGSQTSDAANPKQAVFAGLQIPSSNGNNLTDYVPADNTKKFLTVFDRPKLWRGYPATLSFIYPIVTALNLAVIRAQHDESGALINEDGDAIGPDDPGTVQRLDLMSGFSLDDDAKTLKVKLQGAISVEDSDTGVSGLTTVDLPLGATFLAGSYRFIAFGIMTGTLTSPAVNIYATDGVSTQLIKSGGAITTVAASQIPVAVGFDFDQIRITFNHSGGTPYDYTAAGGVFVDYTEELIFDVEDPCDNPIMLVWKNSLGGDAQWLFQYDQEVSFQMSGRNKSPRKVLADINLTANQWEALNELNTLGEVYKENIIEFTSSIDKSHKRDGAQVYVVDADGNKTGVIVIPSRNAMFTRMQRHQFSVEIELPERFE